MLGDVRTVQRSMSRAPSRHALRATANTELRSRSSPLHNGCRAGEAASMLACSHSALPLIAGPLAENGKKCMDLAAHDAPRCRRNSASERGIRRISWLRAADGLLFYLAPTIIFFIVAAIGLWRLPGDFWGMYGNDDGLWAAWNVRGILEWSRPFDLAPFNPLSGMGSRPSSIPPGSILRRWPSVCPCRGRSVISSPICVFR